MECKYTSSSALKTSHSHHTLLLLLQALGFTCGVFHVECKYTSRGPRLIEVNARMGGGCVR
jgi:biotin carboxylase